MTHQLLREQKLLQLKHKLQKHLLVSVAVPKKQTNVQRKAEKAPIRPPDFNFDTRFFSANYLNDFLKLVMRHFC